MGNDAIAIWLWGKVLGYLSWDKQKHCSTFVFDESFFGTGWDVAPIGWSIRSSSARLPRSGNTGKMYEGLPPFVADSLPDRWGNRVFEAWMKKNAISKRNLTPLDRLSFIGKRGMGALEYQPAQVLRGDDMPIPIAELYELALAVQNNRQEIRLENNEDLLLEDLYRVGTSAGGRRAKAIIAMNETGDIRSGQADLPADYIYYLLKFNDDKDFPFSEVEYAYYKMACAAGINMMPSCLMQIEGKQHFLTERFDRRHGEKMHVLTLAAINPDATSYEDMFAVCRQLHLPEIQLKELFRRMVFNVLGGNVDDHSKNFSFLMDKNGVWSLAPAYDMLFTVDLDGFNFFNRHELSVGAKTDGITLDDLRNFARVNDICCADMIIEEVQTALSEWKKIASEVGVPKQWIGRIALELEKIV